MFVAPVESKVGARKYSYAGFGLETNGHSYLYLQKLKPVKSRSGSQQYPRRLWRGGDHSAFFVALITMEPPRIYKID